MSFLLAIIQIFKTRYLSPSLYYLNCLALAVTLSRNWSSFALDGLTALAIWDSLLSTWNPTTLGPCRNWLIILANGTCCVFKGRPGGLCGWPRILLALGKPVQEPWNQAGHPPVFIVFVNNNHRHTKAPVVTILWIWANCDWPLSGKFRVSKNYGCFEIKLLGVFCLLIWFKEWNKTNWM